MSPDDLAADDSVPVAAIEAVDSSGADVDLDHLVALSAFVLGRLGVHPASELGITVVDEPAIAELNERWMDKHGPTDVLSFPMDELRATPPGVEPVPGVLGDLVLCPQVAARQGAEAGHGTVGELELLTVHGLLHLLGHDHAEPEEHRVMFGLQAELLDAWRRPDVGADDAVTTEEPARD